MSDDGQTVGTLQKNSRERLVVRLTSYEGHDLCDLRVFAEGAVPGTFDKPTHKGVAFRRDLLPHLRALLQEAERIAAGGEPEAAPANEEVPEGDDPFSDQ